MANTKEVRKQISSIKSTRKITSALEMVAASKIKKTQDLMFGGRPYSEKVKEVIEHIASSSSEYSHPFYEERKNKSFSFFLRLGNLLLTIKSENAVARLWKL